MAADFGRVETCSCCGKGIKRPVTIKRLPGMLFGKDCRDAIAATRMTMVLSGEETAIRHAQSGWPRSWEKLVALAR